MQPHMAALGITRLARQTGLDRIGIPVWTAVRPNSLSLAVNQGKGIDDDVARASALMEAAEYAVAERPDAPVTIAAKSDLLALGERVFEPRQQMRKGTAILPDVEIAWLKGRQLFSGEAIWVPLEAVRLDHTTQVFGGLARSSNGLASGNNEDEASLHALCELVERDALTFHGFRHAQTISLSRIEPAAFKSPSVAVLCSLLKASDFHLDLFDITTEIGLPVVQAVIRDSRSTTRLRFDLAAGSGCHPFAPHAAVRAITEAVQTRITHISGARDDLDPAEYRASLGADLDIYIQASQSPFVAEPPSSVVSGMATPAEMLKSVMERLLAANINDVTMVHLGGVRHDTTVMKAFAPLLEDRPVNRYWTPGPRFTKAMLRLW